ncbi:CRAL/TRIO domain-containing protein [Byssothecium circinans]|uniref:CRAL/TRIO domain-containing protein n=1 Tax=Byssothecium circinans TaxID=147558 RepID=A0A6A5TXW0_9PLEO|nr:CRAL/TRIO domain-containing protein [Byssothecium circinans]
MWLRAFTIRRAAYNTASSPTNYRLVAYSSSPSQPHFTLPACRRRLLEPRTHIRPYHRPVRLEKQSASSVYTVAVILGIAVGGALLFPLVRRTAEENTEKQATSPPFDSSTLTDSYLVMAPNTPAGRPGTLTAEQEGKLRELWTMTMKVFGVYEPAAVESNGVDTPSVAASVETLEKDGKKEKKEKKGRLHVFRRNKGEKGADAESTPASGAATPTTSDIGSLSIADEDDKHGQGKEFKLAIANISPGDLRKAFWSMVKHDHPDALLLRFLRARKWDVEKALVMMVSTMHWRLEEMHVDDDIMKKGEEAALKDSKSEDVKVKKEGQDFLAQMRMGKSFLHGLDSDGRPLCVVRARLHRAGEQSEASLERFTVYLIETARMLLRPPVDTATIVFDMTDFSMANMDYTPVKFMIKCFEANYPESLGTVLVYKAPWIFNAIWNIIRGWLDPVVAGKVHFVKNVDELEKYVPRSQIITDLGGDEKWTYEYVEPKEGENKLMADDAQRDVVQGERTELVRRYEKSILEWVAEGSSEKGKSLEDRRKERDAVAEDLRRNYWKLDPYVRARSLWDRTGIIGPEGQLEFYPKAAPAEAKKAEQETSPDDLD